MFYIKQFLFYYKFVFLGCRLIWIMGMGNDMGDEKESVQGGGSGTPLTGKIC